MLHALGAVAGAAAAGGDQDRRYEQRAAVRHWCVCDAGCCRPSLVPCFSAPTGSAFKSVGLADDAVFVFLKAGDVALAVEACLSLQHWSLAVEIAQAYNQPQINPLLTKAAEQLLTLNKLTTAIELYRRAGMHPDAARLLQQLGQEQAATKANPLRAKQLFVLAAAEVEMFRIKSFAVEHNTTATQLGTMAVGTMATMSTLGGGRAGSTVATVQTLSALMDADSQVPTPPPPAPPPPPPTQPPFFRPRTTKS
jgi:WD repeat-containing protein 35